MRYEIERTLHFKKWFKKIRDKNVRYRIHIRLDRVARGNFGDAKQISANLFELRFFFGSGYRIYYTIQDEKIIFLLCGGDKSTQSKDIAQAQALLEKYP